MLSNDSSNHPANKSAQPQASLGSDAKGDAVPVLNPGDVIEVVPQNGPVNDPPASDKPPGVYGYDLDLLS